MYMYSQHIATLWIKVWFCKIGVHVFKLNRGIKLLLEQACKLSEIEALRSAFRTTVEPLYSGPGHLDKIVSMSQILSGMYLLLNARFLICCLLIMESEFYERKLMNCCTISV